MRRLYTATCNLLDAATALLGAHTAHLEAKTNPPKTAELDLSKPPPGLEPTVSRSDIVNARTRPRRS